MKTKSIQATTQFLLWLCTTILLLATSQNAARASIAYGSINNFDTVNDTGVTCHGFEIEVEDCHSTDITYTYNYNHYGVPNISQDDSVAGHPKCRIRWESKKNADGSWAAYTAIPTAPINPTNGHMFTNPSINFGGEHFGVGFRAAVGAVKYNWLIDSGGTLVHGGAVQVSTPSFNYYPPVVGNPAPAQVQAVIAPPPPPAPEPKEFGKAVWVKEIRTTTHNANEVKLRDLVSDDPEDANDKNWRNGEPDEVETEWQILQKDYHKADGGPNNIVPAAAEDLPGGDEVVTRRYEFYKYIGPLDTESGEAKASAVAADGIHGVGVKVINGVSVDLSTVEVVGDFTGSQMAAVDVDAPVGLIDHVGDGQVNQPYAARTVVVEGALPFTAVQEGALPPGMAFDEVTGILSGTPTASGQFKFKVTAADDWNPDVSKNYTVSIAAVGAELAPESLVDTTANPVGSGTTTGDGAFAPGSEVTVIAAANPGFHFLNWTDNGIVVSQTLSYSFNIDVNHSLVANFAADVPQWEIGCLSAPIAGGSTVGGGVFDDGSSVTLVATPNAGYTFVNWTDGGGVVSASTSYTFTASANRTLVANFSLNGVGGNRTISTSSSPVAGGTTSGGGNFADGSSVTVSATPNVGYIFKRWLVNAVSVSSSKNYTFTVNGDRALVAKFELGTRVIATANPSNAGVVTGAGTYPDGDNVSLDATPNEGFTFVNWTENGVEVSTDPSYKFKAKPDTAPVRNLVANFTSPNLVEITTSAAPILGGTTTGGGTISAGNSVTLIATASPGYTFINWTDALGNEVSIANSYSFIPTEAGAYVANFEPEAFGLHFDFDTAAPVPPVNQALPFSQTSVGVTATFNSPTSNDFTVQTEVTTGRTLAKFSGNYLEPELDDPQLEIQLDQPAMGISLDFATLESVQVAVASTVELTAIDNSSGAPVVVGTAIAHGSVTPGDSLPVGTLTFNSAGGSFDQILVRLQDGLFGAPRFLVDNIIVSPSSSTGGSMSLANPNWNITLTDFGYSDYLLDNTPGFEGREYLSGEWGSAIAYEQDGQAVEPTWFEPKFLFPDWNTNSNFHVVTGIHLVGNNLDGLPIAESVIANHDLEITLRYEMVDTVVGTPMGIKPASEAGATASVKSNRYVMNQTFVVKNISGSVINNLQLFQLLHGYISQRGTFDNHSYVGKLSDYQHDVTMSGLDASAAGTQSSSSGLEDMISFHSKVAPTAFEIGHYGIENNGVDDHSVGKPSDGVHLSIEANWATAPYTARQGRDSFAPNDRWIAGGQRWTLGSLAAGQSLQFDILLSLLTGTKVVIDEGSTTGGGSCNGGSSHVGGVDFEFEDIDQEGTFFGEYSEADDDELTEREDDGEFVIPAFQSPAGTVRQLWNLEYNGAHTGNIRLTFAYNPALLPAGYDENQLAIYHYQNGVWEKLPGTVDPLKNQIKVVTPSLSPFMLGVNDTAVIPEVQHSITADGKVSISWPDSFTGWTLQQSTTMKADSWQAAPQAVVTANGTHTVIVPMTENRLFFRLVHP